MPYTRRVSNERSSVPAAVRNECVVCVIPYFATCRTIRSLRHATTERQRRCPRRPCGPASRRAAPRSCASLRRGSSRRSRARPSRPRPGERGKRDGDGTVVHRQPPTVTVCHDREGRSHQRMSRLPPRTPHWRGVCKTARVTGRLNRRHPVGRELVPVVLVLRDARRAAADDHAREQWRARDRVAVPPLVRAARPAVEPRGERGRVELARGGGGTTQTRRCGGVEVAEGERCASRPAETTTTPASSVRRGKRETDRWTPTPTPSARGYAPPSGTTTRVPPRRRESRITRNGAVVGRASDPSPPRPVFGGGARAPTRRSDDMILTQALSGTNEPFLQLLIRTSSRSPSSTTPELVRPCSSDIRVFTLAAD